MNHYGTEDPKEIDIDEDLTTLRVLNITSTTPKATTTSTQKFEGSGKIHSRGRKIINFQKFYQNFLSFKNQLNRSR